jgi:type I restriction enzyme S subunit
VSERIDYGLTASAIDKKDGPRFLRITDMQDDAVDWSTVPSCECSSREYEEKKLAAGDIVFARTGATTGKSYLVRELSEPVVFASYLIRVRASKKIDPIYLSYFFKSPMYWHQIKIMANGAAQPGVNSSKLKELEIPLPPLPEQKRIATILDKADAIRRKRQQAIHLADEFLRAVFLDMFGDPVTNPKNIDTTTIGSLCEVSTGATPSRKIEGYYLGNIPWVKTTEVDGYVIHETGECISKDGLNNSSCKLNPVGSIVLAMYGQGKTRGKVGVLGVEAATNQACAVINPSSKVMMDYLYMYLLLSYESLRCLGQGGGQPNLNLSIVKNFPVLLPSESQQKLFVNICSYAREIESKAVASCQGSKNFFDSLCQKAFKGEL